MSRRTSFGRWPQPGLARLSAFMLAMLLTCRPVAAQEDRRIYAGGMFGVSTLSADGRSVTTAADATLSLYKPENGPALNLFAGVHVAEYFTVQANWMWNRNDVTLVSSFVTPQGGGYYEQRRHSHQHAVVLESDLLPAFGQRRSPVSRDRHLAAALLERRHRQLHGSGPCAAHWRHHLHSPRLAVSRGHRCEVVAPLQVPVQLQRNHQRESDQPFADPARTTPTGELPEPLWICGPVLALMELRVRTARPEYGRMHHSLSEYSRMADSARVH